MGRQEAVASSAWIAQMHALPSLFNPCGLDPIAPVCSVGGFLHARFHRLSAAPLQPKLEIETIEQRAG